MKDTHHIQTENVNPNKVKSTTNVSFIEATNEQKQQQQQQLPSTDHLMPPQNRSRGLTTMSTTSSVFNVHAPEFKPIQLTDTPTPFSNLTNVLPDPNADDRHPMKPQLSIDSVEPNSPYIDSSSTNPFGEGNSSGSNNFNYFFHNGRSLMNMSKKSNSRSGHRVFVRVDNGGNTSSTSTTQPMPPKETVHNHFSKYGKVIDCYLPDSATNVAYVCFEDEGSMTAVLNLSKTAPESSGIVFIEDVRVVISRASPRPDYHIDTDRLFIKNIPDGVTRQDIRTYFEQNFGRVSDVYIPRDKITGQNKKYAFVTFADREVSKLVLGHTNVIHYLADGKPIQVMPAESRNGGQNGGGNTESLTGPNALFTRSPDRQQTAVCFPTSMPSLTTGYGQSPNSTQIPGNRPHGFTFSENILRKENINSPQMYDYSKDKGNRRLHSLTTNNYGAEESVTNDFVDDLITTLIEQYDDDEEPHRHDRKQIGTATAKTTPETNSTMFMEKDPRDSLDEHEFNSLFKEIVEECMES